MRRGIRRKIGKRRGSGLSCGSEGMQARDKLFQYAINLTEWCRRSTELYTFVIDLLGIDSRRKLADYLAGKLEEAGVEVQSDALVAALHEADDFARNIMSAMNVVKDRRLHRGLEAYMRRLVEGERKTGGAAERRKFARQMKSLRELLFLNEDEMDLVCFYFCYDMSDTFEALCDLYKLSEFPKFVSAATGIPQHRVRKLLGSRGRLMESGVMEERSRGTAPYRSLDDHITDYLMGLSDVPLWEKYCRKDSGPTFDLASFNVSEKETGIIRALLSLDRPCNILLHGNAGTGKTEFARAIGADCGRPVFLVQHTDDGDIADLRLALQVAVSTASGDGGLVVVDEADTFLNTKYMFHTTRKTMEKGWLNSFLDQTKAKVIWITNERGFMEQSVCRRFSYSLYFRDFTKRDRVMLWAELVKEHPLRRFLDDNLIRTFAAKYPINAGGIASALDAADAIVGSDDKSPEEVSALVEELLSKHEELTFGRRRGTADTPTSRYDVSALNVDADVDAVLGTVRSYARNREREDGGVNLLLWGKPGTGKTEFAKYLATETGMDLIFKRGSDLLNMYVGQTEKLIAHAFREAERAEAILFLDEADSFFTRRETAMRSWEVTQTNELLTQMENFRGVFICCTNLLEGLDHAAMRRFNWKVEFRSLRKDGKIMLYRKYFGDGGYPGRGRTISSPLPEGEVDEKVEGEGVVLRVAEAGQQYCRRGLTAAQEHRVRDIPDLTPGDIKAVWLKYRYVPGTDVDPDGIIEALESEVKYRGGSPGGKIGFQS